MSMPDIEGRDCEFEPDYNLDCTNCGTKPTVVAVETATGGRHHFELCGPCCFGTAAALDTDWWNNQEE